MNTEARTQTQASAKPDILLIEDNLAHAELIMRGFTQKSPQYSVLHLEDGSKALDYLFARGTRKGAEPLRPSLILLDIRLPRVDGHEVLKTLKADPDTAEIPVIMLSTSSSQEDVVSALDRDVEDYLVKPFGDLQMSSILRRLER